MKNNIYTMQQQLEKNSLIIFIVGIAGILGFIVTLATNISSINNYMTNTFFEKQIIMKNIESLVPMVNIGFFKNKLGEPTFINNRKHKKEYIFVNAYSYIDAVTTDYDEVLQFAVTIRDKNFNPTFVTPNYPTTKSFKVTLGITKASDLNILPGWFGGCVYGKRFHYYEYYNFGNTGNNDQYGLVINDAGYLPKNVSIIKNDLKSNAKFCSENEGLGEQTSSTPIKTLQDLITIRRDITFNTYIETAPFADAFVYTNFGVDSDQVRLLKPD